MRKKSFMREALIKYDRSTINFSVLIVRVYGTELTRQTNTMILPPLQKKCHSYLQNRQLKEKRKQCHRNALYTSDSTLIK